MRRKGCYIIRSRDISTADGQAHNLEVVGSNPSLASKFSQIYRGMEQSGSSSGS